MCGWGHSVADSTPRRGQSNVVAVVLLAGLVVAGATVVVYAGSTAIDQNQDEASFAAAEQSMQTLAQRVQQVSAGDSSDATVDLSTRGGDVQLAADSPGNPAEAGEVTVTVDPPSGSATTEDWWLGTVRYEQDGQTVAYQGGGVWRSTGDGSVAVSSPPVSYRAAGSGDGTLTFPVVTVDGDAASSAVSIESVERRDLLSTLGLSNPVQPGTTITIEIRSEFYPGWAGELRAELGPSAVSVSPADRKVTVTLQAPSSSSAPAAVLGTNPTGGLALANFGATDSYDSTSGPYPGWPANHNADVLTNGAIDPSNKGSVRGTLVAENGLDGTTSLSNKMEIYGRTVFGDDPDIGSSDYLTVDGNDQTFHGLFSTKDNLKLSKPTVFNSGVVTAGDLEVDAGQNNRPEIRNDGDLVVYGEVESVSAAHVTGNLVVDGDADSVGTEDLDVDGDLVVNGHLDLDSDADIDGDVVVPQGSSPDVDGSVGGSVRYVDFSDPSVTYVDDAQSPITPDVPARASADSSIDSWASTLTSSNNDNGAEPVIDDSTDTLDFAGTSDHELDAGEYYLERLTVPDGETLTLDTSGGDVVIYVPNHASLTALRVSGTIDVDGPDTDNRVRIYVDDAPGGDSQSEFEVAQNGSPGAVTVPDDRTANLWVYTRPTADVEFNNDVTFQGVLYGAGTGPGTGAEISLSNWATVYGSVIGDVVQIPNHAQVHYDEALSNRQAFSSPPGVATIEYVHLSQQTATVDG